MAGLASALTDTGTSPATPLGREFLEPASSSAPGDRVWVYVYNSSAADLEPGMACVRKAAATTTFEVLKSTAGSGVGPGACVGFAQHTIPAGEYGWIQKRGPGLVLAGNTTGIAAGEAIIAGLGAGVNGSSAKQVLANTATHEDVVPSATATVAIAADATGTAYIHCV
jgi:hypothetical protein